MDLSTSLPSTHYATELPPSPLLPTGVASIATHSFIFIVKRRQITVRFLNCPAQHCQTQLCCGRRRMLKRSRALPLSLSLSVRLMLLTALLARSRSSVAPRTMLFLLYAGVDVVVGIGTSARSACSSSSSGRGTSWACAKNEAHGEGRWP